MKEKTLADRCYESEAIDMELFDEVNRILGTVEANIGEPGFIFQAHDTWWDSYDQSVEVVRDLSSEWMSDEQAKQIFALGFRLIYESKGEECRHITAIDDKVCASAPKTGGHRDGGELRMVKKELANLREKLDNIEGGAL